LTSRVNTVRRATIGPTRRREASEAPTRRHSVIVELSDLEMRQREMRYGPYAPSVHNRSMRPAPSIGANYVFGFGAPAKLITVLHLKQVKVSQSGLSSLTLSASIATPQTGHGFIGGRGRSGVESRDKAIVSLFAQSAGLEIAPK
jgi:hypothetical protein